MSPPIEIVATLVITSNVHDATVLEDLVEQVSGDGTYDTRNVYKVLPAQSTRATVPSGRTHEDLKAQASQCITRTFRSFECSVIH